MFSDLHTLGYAHMYTHVSTHIHTHLYTHAHINITYTYMPTQTSIHNMHTSIYSCICLHPYTLVYTYIYIHMHTPASIHTYICMHTNVSIHTCTDTNNPEAQLGRKRCNAARKTIEPGKPYSIEAQQLCMEKEGKAFAYSTEAILLGTAFKWL